MVVFFYYQSEIDKVHHQITSHNRDCTILTRMYICSVYESKKGKAIALYLFVYVSCDYKREINANLSR